MSKRYCGTAPDYSLYSTKYQMNLRGLMSFELKSFFGRLFLKRKPPVIDLTTNLLHLGSGSNFFEGWVNADFFRPKFWKAPKSLWMLDLRYPLCCDSDYWDGIFTEHTLEHLYPTDARNLLGELLRTLRPKHWLRICVPDLGRYINYYLGSPSHENFARWSTGAEAIRALTQNWGHRSVWDSQLLGLTLRQVGFVNVRQAEFMKGADKRLLKDNEARRYESLCMEAQNP